MVKQRAVDAGAIEIRRILQGGTTSRPAFAETNVPPPDRFSSFVSAGGQPLQVAVQMQQNMPAQHEQFLPQAGPAQQPPEMTVSLYVGVEAVPSFNLHQRLRGLGMPTAFRLYCHCSV